MITLPLRAVRDYLLSHQHKVKPMSVFIFSPIDNMPPATTL